MAATDILPATPAPATPRGVLTRMLARIGKRLQRGSLRVATPDGQVLEFHGSEPGAQGELRVVHWAFARRVLRGAEIGFAEAYRDGLFETPDLTALLAVLSVNYPALERGMPLGRLLMGLQRLLHVRRRNSRRGSRRNIHAHYDLGNEFYRAWLDPGMTYSSALFPGGDRSGCLRAAQLAKFDRILDRLALPAGAHLLEIGCGWGGFAEHAARQRGLRVTAITISRAQFEYARRRIEAAGLAGQVDIRLADYRDVPGRFDAVVSIEMFEAVGEEYWPVFFRTLRERLRAGGHAVIQTITIAEDKFDLYRRTTDFIREFIFPGGLLPSPGRFLAEAQRAGFAEAGHHSFGTDYAETLRRWRAAFDDASHRVRALGFDERFLRLWRFYLTYCEVGFDQRMTDVAQFHLTAR